MAQGILMQDPPRGMLSGIGALHRVAIYRERGEYLVSGGSDECVGAYLSKPTQHQQTCAIIAKLTNTPAVDGIPTTDNNSRHQIVLVLIAQPSHQMRRHLDGRHPTRLDGQLAQIMLDVVGQRLGIGGTARPAAPDAIVELGDLVGDAVGHVRAGGDAGVGTEDDAAGEGDGDDGRARGDFAGTEVARFGRLAVVGAAHCGGCVMVVGKGAHLGFAATKQERWYLKGGTAPKVVESCRVFGFGLGFDPDFRQLRDQQPRLEKFSTATSRVCGKSASPRAGQRIPPQHHPAQRCSNNRRDVGASTADKMVEQRWAARQRYAPGSSARDVDRRKGTWH